MTRSIDFATLTLKDALDLGVLIEEEAMERYEEFVHQMETHHTPEAAAFFKLMVQNESKHGQQLAKKRKELFADQPRRVDRSMLWDVEAPEYDKARALMTPRQALELALAAETKAHDFFANALPRITQPDVRKLFEELRLEEVEHQTMLRRELAKLPPGPDANPDDYADEPVAQD